jgi:hypothetical protein
MGEPTYWDEFVRLAAQYPKFNFETLDKTLTYTIGFRSPHFHPLKTDTPALWLVAATSCQDLTTRKVDIGIPYQDAVAPIGTNGQEKLTWILAQCRDAYRNYTRDRTQHCYGFILRGDFAKCGDVSNVIFESSLMKRVRKLMYNLPKHGQVSTLLNEKNRLEYNVLRSYLTFADRTDFLTLFPEYKPMYQKYDQMIAQIIESMVKCYRNRNLRTKLNVNKPTPGAAPTIDSIASSIMTHIGRNEQINVMSPKCETIIYNFVVDPKYLDLYFAYLQA